ncbi:MAG: nuclease A inhibitor family protein [Acidobacteriota bacterium]|nr:nuclease A inhibitor family protein [Acidobacteriota bacterium]
MLKRKKKIKKPKAMNSNETDLPSQIKKLTDGLYYISETDAEILPFVGKKSQAVTSEEIKNQIESADASQIEERDFTEFFARLTEIQDWFGEEEKATAQKFSDLKSLLEKNLKDLKVFKVGKIQIDIYVVGLDAASNLMGIKTKAVET